jgi:hypothetical protein
VVQPAHHAEEVLIRIGVDDERARLAWLTLLQPIEFREAHQVTAASSWS